MNSPILRFYRGGSDHDGRSLDEVLAWDDQQLETCHDYIQWLFPLDQPSAYNPDAPTLSTHDRSEFERDPRLQQRLLAALARLLGFYGFQLEATTAGVDVRPGPLFDVQQQRWLTPQNHNFLRITRILRSLVLLGQRPYAAALLRCLEHVYAQHAQRIGATSLGFWRQALELDPEG